MGITRIIIRCSTDGGTATGYKHMLLSPCMPVGLNHVKASLEALPGRIVSGWERLDRERYNYEVSIPANTSATVLLPTGGRVKLTESGKLVWHDGVQADKIPGIHLIKEEEGHLLLRLGSGNYRFTVEKTSV